MSDRLTRFLISLSQDADGMAAFADDPELVLSRADLTPEEKEVVRRGDAEAIYQRMEMETGIRLAIPESNSNSNIQKPRPPKPPKPPAPKPQPKKAEASL
jgi:Aromatic-ring-opening dioxygenase LigAB, LigA subunit